MSRFQESKSEDGVLLSSPHRVEIQSPEHGRGGAVPVMASPVRNRNAQAFMSMLPLSNRNEIAFASVAPPHDPNATASKSMFRSRNRNATALRFPKSHCKRQTLQSTKSGSFPTHLMTAGGADQAGTLLPPEFHGPARTLDKVDADTVAGTKKE